MPDEARFEPIDDLAALERRWRALEAQSASSFFLRWTWMGSWLEALHEAGIALPQLLVVGNGEAMALVGRGRAKRRFGTVAAIWLNECGVTDGDSPFIEYNGILGDVASAIAALAARREWAALYLSGVEPGSIVVPGRRTVIRAEMPVHFVDLEKVRKAGGDYLSLLGANSRAQIRRSMKDTGSDVCVSVLDAADLDSALSEMAHLNAGRHADNAWDSALFRDFVSRIAHRGAADGSVELLTVTAGAHRIGMLLNFVWDGVAMNYQSAFAAPASSRDKPGLTTHAAVVRHYAMRGLSRYSFLAGNDRYKANLATDAETLQWLVVERSHWRLAAEALLRRLLRR